jgi:hypothetical protein
MGEALVEGTKGTLTLLGDGSVKFRAFGQLDDTPICAPDIHDGFGGDCVHAFQQHAIDGFFGEGELETVASDYLTVVKIENAIYTSAQEGRKVQLT